MIQGKFWCVFHSLVSKLKPFQYYTSAWLFPLPFSWHACYLSLPYVLLLRPLRTKIRIANEAGATMLAVILGQVKAIIDRWILSNHTYINHNLGEILAIQNIFVNQVESVEFYKYLAIKFWCNTKEYRSILKSYGWDRFGRISHS